MRNIHLRSAPLLLYAFGMTTKTHAITHSPVFLRTLNRQASDSLVCATLHHELLHGVAAQDAFVALFDEFDDFEELAYEAAKAPIPPYEPDVVAKRERQAANRVGGARSTAGARGKRKTRTPAPSMPRGR